MLERFKPTADTASERRKAHYKNLNIPILQHWYQGDPQLELKCSLTQTSAWLPDRDRVTGEPLLRFRIDFNHIRQQNRFLLGLTRTKSPGVSVDKTRDPSALFRSQDLSLIRNRMFMLEFMCCMAVSVEQHKFITQDSAKNHICLDHFPEHTHPWGLQSRLNFDLFQQTYWGRLLIDWEELVDLLKDPLAPPYWHRFQI